MCNYSLQTDAEVTSVHPTGMPKAHLNWIIYDRNYVLLDLGYVPLQGGSEDGTDKAFYLMSKQITVTDSGYVYIWFSNDAQTQAEQMEVYFDDFKVTQVKSPVIETSDYYPFGLISQNYSRENVLPDQYKYNGKELQDELNLGWLDYGPRMYQPELGRFFNLDRKAELFMPQSPYVYAANDPIKFVDRNGEGPDDPTKPFSGHAYSDNGTKIYRITTEERVVSQIAMSIIELNPIANGASMAADGYQFISSRDTDQGLKFVGHTGLDGAKGYLELATESGANDPQAGPNQPKLKKSE
jgi:RHS repeat-associated protein